MPFTSFKKKQKFCCLKCSSQYKNLSRRELRSDWKNYRADCQFRFNLKDYPNEFDFNLIEKVGWYSPSNKKNNLQGVSRDHMVSCRYGFDNNIPAEQLRHPANCELMIHGQNVSKYTNNSITYEELLQRIKEWDNRYPGI